MAVYVAGRGVESRGDGGVLEAPAGEGRGLGGVMEWLKHTGELTSSRCIPGERLACVFLGLSSGRPQSRRCTAFHKLQPPLPAPPAPRSLSLVAFFSSGFSSE